MSEHYPSCPVSGQMVNSRAAQINALAVVAFIAAAILLRSPWPVAILAVDFAIKVLVGFKQSPVSAFARWTVKTLKLKGEMMDLAPKRFAASMGLAFALTGLVCAVLGQWAAFAIVLGTCGFCALLEGTIGLCVGCRIYLMLPDSMKRTARHRVNESA